MTFKSFKKVLLFDIFCFVVIISRKNDKLTINFIFPLALCNGKKCTKNAICDQGKCTCKYGYHGNPLVKCESRYK